MNRVSSRGIRSRIWRLAGPLAALTLLVSAAPANAQQVTSQAVLDRVTIVEGQTRTFQISNLTSRPRYHVHASVAGSFTAEAGDITITTDNLRGQAQTITPDTDAPRAHRNTTYGTIRFEVTANSDSDGAGDETFGVRLCTTADCTAGTILGEWTVTVAEPAADTTLNGTGATVTVPGGGAVSVMEDSRNRDSRDRRATFSIDITTAPTADIVVVAYTETGVSTGATTTAPFARINSSLSRDYYPRSNNLHDPVRAEYVVGYWASGATGSQEFTVISTDNAADTPGGTVSGTLKFRVLEGSAFGSNNYTDGTFNNATVYSGITIPDLPVHVTDDDEPTRVRVLAAASEDNQAMEGNTNDTAKFLVKLERPLAAGESITAPLRFIGATLGTNFTVALDSAGSDTGASYADTPDTTQTNSPGAVTFTGAGAREATLEVTAIMDSDSISHRLEALVPEKSDRSKPFHFVTHDAGGVETLHGGACAARACDSTQPTNRSYFMDLNEAAAGITIVDDRPKWVTEGGTYDYEIRLSARPSADVTVTTTVAPAGKASVSSGGTLTFTTSNWDEPQDVAILATENNREESNSEITVTHDVTASSDSSYSGLANVTYVLTVVDNEETHLSMSGAGVRTSPNGSQISRVMVEGNAALVDRSLTISLDRPLVAGEYLRVPLKLEAVANGHQPEIPGLITDEDGELVPPDPPGAWPADLHDRRIVTSVRGPRASANVAWPPHHNDFVIKATGTGVTYEPSNRHTPPHIGYGYLEFRGAGARSARFELHARDGFDDGEGHDEAFAIMIFDHADQFPDRRDAEFDRAPWEHNLGGGVFNRASGHQAWFGIKDDDAGVRETIQVPGDWPLLPPGLSLGDTFRLLYVTNAETAATSTSIATYDAFVRAEITGAGLKAGGVEALKPHVDSFRAIAGTASEDGNGRILRTSTKLPASVHAMFSAYGPWSADHPNEPIYWVGGTKVADDNSDFTDRDWDDESNPRHADGSAATIHTDGYWTGSQETGDFWSTTTSDRTGSLLDQPASCSHSSNGGDEVFAMGATLVFVGHLDDSDFKDAPLGRDIGDTRNGTQPGNDACTGAPNTELRPMYALSGVFSVGSEGVTVDGGTTGTGNNAVTVANPSAAEGGAITFTVTLPAAAPTGGINVPYTFTDGRGIPSDPAHAIATGASGGTGADYANDTGSVAIAQGDTTGTFTVATTNDSTYEGDHYFTVTLGTPTAQGGETAPGLHPTGKTAIGIITDAADRPAFGFSPATATAGEGDGTISVTVTKTGTTEVASSVYWTTADGTGAGGAAHPGDYTADAGYLQFAPGDTSETLTIDITDDAAGENAETFKVQLSEPSEATLGSASEATVTLNDDDGGGVAPPLAVPTVQFKETAIVVFESNTNEFPYIANPILEASSAVMADTVVSFTVGGTATLDTDYFITFVTSSTSETIKAGATEEGFNVRVWNIDGDEHEPDETVILTLVDGEGYDLGEQTTMTVTIRDLPDVQFAEATSTGPEGTTVTVNVEASHAFTSPTDTDVMFTVGGTATAADYTAPASPVRFGTGESTATITIPITLDMVSETGETIVLNLTDSNGYDLGGQTRHTVTLEDNLALLPLSVKFTASGSSVQEGAGTATVTVEASHPASEDTAVAFTVTHPSQDAATAGTDYTTPTSPVTISSGQTTATISIPILDDNDDCTEQDGVYSCPDDGEKFILTLTDGADYDLADTNTRHTVTIFEDPVKNDEGEVLAGGKATINLTEPRLHLTEGGPSVRYGISLTRNPKANVDVYVTSPDIGLFTVAGADGVRYQQIKLRFTRRNWDSPQFVTVQAVEDDDKDSEQNMLIDHAIRGSQADSANFEFGSPYFSHNRGGTGDDSGDDIGVLLPDLPVYIADDDATSGDGGLTLEYVDADAALPIVIEEGKATTLRLRWSRALTTDETASARLTITGGAHGEDKDYQLSTDTPNVTVEALPVGVAKTEFVVTWAKAATRNAAVIKIKTRNNGRRATGERNLSVELLDAFSADGSAGRNDTPSGVRLKDGPREERIHVLSRDRLVVQQTTPDGLVFSGLETTGDDAELTTDNAWTEIDEDGAATHKVALSLSRAPTKPVDVVVTISTSDSDKLSVAGSSDGDGVVDTVTWPSLTGLISDYEHTFTVEFTAQEDADADAEIVFVYFTMTSGYGNAHPDGTLARAFRVNINDNNAGVSVTPASLRITEGASRGARLPDSARPRRFDNQVAVCLNTDPEGTVVLTPMATDAGTGLAATGINFSANRLTFTSGNWDRCQRIGFTADDDDDGDNEEMLVGWNITGYSGVSAADVPTVNITVLDDDPAVRISESEIDMVEGVPAGSGGARSYNVVLNAPPAAGEVVIVTPTSSDPGVVSFDANSAVGTRRAIYFGTANWDTPRRVIIYALSDSDEDDETATITHDVSGGGGDRGLVLYSGVTAPSITVNVLDKDGPEGIVLSTDSVRVEEGGASALFTVRLAGRPSGPVSLNVTGAGGVVSADTDLSTDGEQTTLTFTQQSWHSPKTVWLSAQDESDTTDTDDEFVTLMIGDSGSTAYAPVPLAVTVLDDEFTGPTFTVTGSGTLTEGVAAAAIFTVSADISPTGALPVTLNISETADFVAAANEGDQTLSFSATRALINHSVPIDDDSIPEDDGSITATLKPGSGYRVGTPSSATVSVMDDPNDTAPVDIALSASDGDADGNAVEGATGATGHRTLTLTLSRALTAGETVTVPLTVRGATVVTDYTFGLQGTNTGVTLDTSGTGNSAQNPAVQFASGATSATLRLTPVDNGDRTQPYVVVSYGTDSRAPSAGNTTLGAVSGGPIGIVLVDDETGDITVPADWDLLPSHIGSDEDFRLLFRTSPAHLTDATSTDIAYYDAFVRGALAVNGHAAIKPYAGFFKVLGSTRSGSGSAGATARFHNGLVTTGQHNDHHDGTNDEWADGSTRSARGTNTHGSAAGTPTYWLNGNILANNFADLCDINWRGSPGISNGFDQNDPRSEDGTQNVPDGNVTNPRRYEPWTGSGNTCEAWNHPLGANTVSRGGHSAGNNLLHAAAAANTQERPLLGLSPVFTHEEVPTLSFSKSSFSIVEGGTLELTVNADMAPDSALAVTYIVRDVTTDAGADYTVPSGSFTFPADATSTTIPINLIDDDILENSESASIMLQAGDGYLLGLPLSAIIGIIDDDEATVTLDRSAYTVLEDTGSLAVTATLNAAAEIDVGLTLSLSDGSAVGASGGTGADYDNDALMQIIAAGDTTATFNVPITDDSAQETDETFDVALSSSETFQVKVDTSRATVTIADNDHAQGLLIAPSGSLTVDEGTSATYTVRPATAPTGAVTVTISGAANGIIVDTDPSMVGEQNTLTFTTSDWYVAQTVTVRAAQDSDSMNQTATLTHTPSGGGYSSSHAATLTVTANDTVTVLVPVLQFASATYSVTEPEGLPASVTLTVNANMAPSAELPVEVTLSGPNTGEVINEETYEDASIQSGQMSGTFAVEISADRVYEGDETITVTIEAPDDGSYTVGSQASATLTITDADTVDARLTSAAYLVLEDGREGQGAATANGTLSVAVELFVPDSSFFVDFASRSEKDVAVTLTPSNGTAVGASDGTGGDFDTDAVTLTIPAGSVRGIAEIPITDDGAVESDETFTVALSVDAGQPRASVGTPGSATVAVVDNDTPAGLLFDQVSVAVHEGASATYTVRLAAAPTGNVTVTITGMANGVTVDTDPLMGGDQNTLRFSATDWFIPRTVTVSSTADANAIDETVTLQHAPTGGGYGSAQNAGLDATVDDGDTADGVTVSPITLALTELGTSSAIEKTYTVVLDIDPGADVTITATNGDATAVEVDTDSGMSGNQSTLTFTAGGNGSGSGTGNGDWAVAQTVTVRALNDGDGASESFSIAHTATAASGPFDGISIVPVAVTVTDAGHGVAVSESSLSVAENDETATYTVALKSQPSSIVVVSATSGATGTATVSPGTLTFGTSDWNTPQTFTVTGKGAGSTSISHAVQSSPDTVNYPTSTTISAVSVTVTPDTRPTVSLSPSVINVNEGEDAEFTLTLSAALGADVTIPVTVTEPELDVSASGDDYTAPDPSSATITAGETEATFTIATTDDEAVEGAELLQVAIDTGNLPASVRAGTATSGTIIILNNDEGVPVSMSAANASVREGESLEVFFELAEALDKDVQIPIHLSGDATDVTDPVDTDNAADYTVTIAEGDTTGSVTVTTLQDTLVEGRETFSVGLASSSDARDLLWGQGLDIDSDADTTRVAILDDDLVTLTESSGSTVVNEDGTTDSYVVRLNGLTGGSFSPSTVVATAGDGVQVSASGNTPAASRSMNLHFQNQTGTVHVHGVDDDLDNPGGSRNGRITHAVTLTSAGWPNGAVDDILATIVDDDPTTVTLSGAAGDIEEGQTKEFTVTLGRGLVDGETLTAPLTFGGTATRGTDYTMTGANATGVQYNNLDSGSAAIVFTGPQSGATATTATVTLSAASDSTAESTAETVIIGLGTVTDTGLANFGGVSESDSLADFNISDPAPGDGVTVSTASLALTELGAASDVEKTYTLVLDTDPGADVTVTVTNGDSSAVEVDTDSSTGGNQNTLTFTHGGSGNWNTARTVTVRALNDADGANESFNLTHAAAVSDTGNPYHGIAIDPVAVTTADAGHGVAVSESSLSVAENDETATYTVALKSQPSGNVAISATSGATGTATVSPGTLTFGTSNWNTPQTFTVTGKSAGSTSISHAVSTTADATNYPMSLTISGVSVTVTAVARTVNITGAPFEAWEGESVNVPVELSRARSVATTIELEQSGPGTATAGADFTAGPWSVTIPAGQTTASASIALTQDTALEMDEAFNVRVRQSTLPAGVAAGAGAARVTIRDDEYSLCFDRNAYAVNEHAGEVDLPLSLSRAVRNDVTVYFDYADRTAVAGADYDEVHASSSDTVTIAAGSRNLTLTVPVHPDLASTANKSFDVTARPSELPDGQTACSTQVIITSTGLVIVETGGDTAVTEDGSDTDTYTIALEDQPDSDVTVTVTAGAGARVNRAGGTAGPTQTLTFGRSGANIWSTAQTVTVTGVDDSVDNPGGGRDVAIGHAASSTDADYTIASAGEVAVRVADDDATAVTLAGAAGDIEEGQGKEFTVTLGRGLVDGEVLTVPLTFGGTATRGADYTMTGATATGVSYANLDSGNATVAFTGPETGATATAATITLSAASDGAAESTAESVVVGLGTITGLAGAGGAAGTDSLADFNIADPPPGAGVTVSTGSLALTELGGADDAEKTYTLVLNTDPGADVTVTVANGDTTAVEVDTDSAMGGNQSTLTFTAGGDGSGSGTGNGDWAVARTVTARALNDADAANESFNLTHAATAVGDAAPYHGIAIDPVAVTTADAGHGVAVSESALSVAENDETATYTVVLKSQPSGSVVISATSGATGTATVSPGTLAFGNSDWNTPQTVTVTGKGTGSTSIGHAVATSADTTNYPTTTTIPAVSVTVTADTRPEVTVTPDGATVSEGEGDPKTGGTQQRPVRFTVSGPASLSSSLSASFTLSQTGSFVASLPAGGNANLSAPPFNAQNSDPYAVADDSTDEPNGSVTATLVAGTGYRIGSPGTATVLLIDNDPTTVTLGGGGTVMEDGSDSADVTVTLGRNLVAGEEAAVPLAITGAGVAAGDYTVMLAPGSNLNAGVALDTDSPHSAAEPAVVFTGHGTDTVRVATLRVTAVQDTADEGASETLSVGFGSGSRAVTSNLDRADPSTTGAGGTTTAGTATVTITDDDTAVVPVLSVALPSVEGVSRNTAGQLVFAETGAGSTQVSFDVTLDPAPSANFTACVRVAEAGGDRVAAAAEGVKAVTVPSTGTLAHTVAWTDTAADDRDSVVTVEAVAPGTAGCSAANGTYTVLSTEASDAALVRDDEATAVQLTGADRIMAEGDATDTAALQITLARRLYAGEVVVVPFTLATTTGARLPGNATPDFAVSAAGTGVTIANANTATPSLTFTGHGVDTVRTASVTLTPVAGRDDGDTAHEEITMTLAPDSVLGSTSGSGTTVGGGAMRHGTNFAADLTLNDDEAPKATVTFSVGDLRLLENGSATYTVVLDQAPTAAVTLQIFLAGDDTSAVMTSAGFLTFNPSGGGIWNSPQTVTVTGVDEPGARRNRALTLRHTASSLDGSYNAEEYDLPVAVDDAPEVEAWEGWVRAEGDRGDGATLSRPDTVSSTPGIWPRQDMVFGDRPQDYVIRLSNRPEPGGTVTVVATPGNADVQLGLTRTGPWSNSLTVTFGDGFAEGAAAPNMAACNNSHDHREGGEAHDGTAATSWECWRKVWVRRVGNGHQCTDIAHSASGGGVRARAIETIRVHNPASVRGASACGFLTAASEPMAQNAPAVEVPTARVANLEVAKVDADTVSASWDAVEHATGYEVAWDALDGGGQSIAAGLATGVAGTSETIEHHAPGAASLRVTVAPEYVDGDGDTQTLAGLAATATLDLGSTGTGDGDSTKDGGGDTDSVDSQTPNPPPASCVSDDQWSTVAGYYDSNANRSPNYGVNWYRVLIAYRRARPEKALPDWEGATAQPTAAYTVEEAEDGEKVWSGWTPVRKVLECLENPNGGSTSAVAGDTPNSGPSGEVGTANPNGAMERDRRNPETAPGGFEPDAMPDFAAGSCVSPRLRSEAVARAGETWRGPGHVERWLRVAQTFSGGANDAMIVTPAEAHFHAAAGQPGWLPVADALRCMEQQSLRKALSR